MTSATLSLKKLNGQLEYLSGIREQSLHTWIAQLLAFTPKAAWLEPAPAAQRVWTDADFSGFVPWGGQLWNTETFPPLEEARFYWDHAALQLAAADGLTRWTLWAEVPQGQIPQKVAPSGLLDQLNSSQKWTTWPDQQAASVPIYFTDRRVMALRDWNRYGLQAPTWIENADCRVRQYFCRGRRIFWRIVSP